MSDQAPVAWLWENIHTGQQEVVMPNDLTTPNERWRIIGPLYLAPPDAAITQDWSMLEASQESLREHMLEIARLRAENERLREAGVGYSQQTVDALTKERDTLRELMREIYDSDPGTDWDERAEKALAS
jgi:hypothetical protein